MNSRLGIIGVVLGIVVLALLWIVFLTPGWHFSFAHAQNLISAPSEVKAMRFIVANENSVRGIGRVFLGGIYNQFFDEGSVVEVLQHGGQTYVLIEDQEGDRDVYHVRGGVLEPLTTNGGYKAGLAFSPDGVFFTYATRGPAFEGVGEDVFDIRRFTTTVIAIESGGMYREYQGTWPHFLSANSLILFSEHGISVHGLQSNNVTTLRDDLPFRMITQPAFAGDTFVVYEPLTTQFDMYRITSASPFFFEYVTTIEGGDVYDAGATSDRVFALIDEGDVTHVAEVAESGVTTILITLSEDVLVPLAFDI